MAGWTFVTNHAAVLALIAKKRRIKAADIAQELELTERSVRRIIADLAANGYVTMKREGRINRYTVNPGLPLRRPEMRDVKIHELMKVFLGRTPEKRTDGLRQA